MNAHEPPTRDKKKRRILLAIQIAGSACGFAYIAAVADLGAAFDAALSAPLTSLGAAIAIGFATLGVGALRWQILLRAYGATQVPALRRLYLIYLVGLFYNCYLPGGVGGDVVRGVVSREAFGAEGVTRGIAVVTVERALGLSGLLLVCAGALYARPVPTAIPSEAALGLAVACTVGVVVGLAWARRLAPRLPGALARVAGALPRARSLGSIGIALALSVVTQLGVALAGHAVLSAIEPRAMLADSLFIVPLAAATAFLPITVGGAGAREAAFVVLAATVIGTSQDRATAASLLLWASQLVVAGVGGIVQIFLPVTRVATRADEAS